MNNVQCEREAKIDFEKKTETSGTCRMSLLSSLLLPCKLIILFFIVPFYSCITPICCIHYSDQTSL